MFPMNNPLNCLNFKVFNIEQMPSVFYFYARLGIYTPYCCLPVVWGPTLRGNQPDTYVCVVLHHTAVSNALPPLPLPRVSFCAEHARRNAMALRAQLRKSSSGPSPEALLAQLSGYSRSDGLEGGRSLEDGRSEASRILGEQRDRGPGFTGSP